ncbi:glycosyltransferase [Desulfotignum balticum]|uniref:glycosyltransferase n=1 Tax=Desulfotignum balticum TaxID=115781 RepID=UPI0004628A3E|nr:nucleotide disphospho-sugar-binding domain-containing protein [Desulfotignum balticum]
MKIILATSGSRGDVQPMIAICLALKSSGHDAMLLGPPEKAAWAARLGCPYQGFGADVSAFIDGFQHALNFRAGLAFVSFVRKEIEKQFRWLPDIIRKADLVLGSSLMFGLASVAETQNIPYRYIAFTPQLFPSRFHPFPILKTQTLPFFINTMSWKTAELLDQFNITFLINQYRKKQGLEPVSYAWDHILGKNTIVAADKEIAKMPGDVTQTWIQTGYPHLETAGEQVPALDRFLEKGTRPVYAGFGSMPVKDQISIVPILIQAARNLGRRIILPRFHGLSTETTPGDDLFFIRDYPHLRLFPKLDAVIHHGGAGTTATAGASCVPQIIVPHILDQYYHGRRIFLSHIGPEPIPRALLTEARLTAALEQCLFDPGIRQAAKKTGQSINPQKSLGRIVEAILS